MKKARFFGLYTLIGAVSYWATNLLIQWIGPAEGLIRVVLLTVLVPAIVSLVYFFLLRRHPHSQYPLALPLFMLLGIWLFGPLAIILGPGFSFPASGYLFFIFPVMTFILATYSGSLGGLVITSCLLAIYSIAAKKDKASGGSPLPPTQRRLKPDLVSILSEWKLIVVSLILGVSMTAASLAVAAIWADYLATADILVWPVIILLWPIYLIAGLTLNLNIGTTLELFWVMLGLILSAIFNGGMVYLGLRVTKIFRGSARKESQSP